jgi:hypothetical protein
MSYDRYSAIHSPLHYPVLMTKKICFLLMTTSCVIGFFVYLCIVIIVFNLSFCNSNTIQNFISVNLRFNKLISYLNQKEYLNLCYKFKVKCFYYVVVVNILLCETAASIINSTYFCYLLNIYYIFLLQKSESGQNQRTNIFHIKHIWLGNSQFPAFNIYATFFHNLIIFYNSMSILFHC